MNNFYTALALFIPFWFPAAMMIIGESLIFKIKNMKIKLVLFVIYAILCVTLFFYKNIAIIPEIYFFLGLTLPYWFPALMLIAGTRLILKIQNLKIKLILLIIYVIFCVIMLFGVKGL